MAIRDGDTFEVSNKDDIKKALERIEVESRGDTYQKPQIYTREEIKRMAKEKKVGTNKVLEEIIKHDEDEAKKNINFV